MRERNAASTLFLRPVSNGFFAPVRLRAAHASIRGSLQSTTSRAISYRLLFAAIASLVIASLSHGGAHAAGRRLALVVGDSAYQHAPYLKNPRNDVNDLAVVLERLGFTVIKGIDLDKPAMDRKIQEFAAALHGAEAGVFFYSGHGLQVNGINYLVPIDAELASAAAPDFELVRLDAVQRSMERESTTNILFLDACRNNPLARNLARGMGTRSAEIGRGSGGRQVRHWHADQLLDPARQRRLRRQRPQFAVHRGLAEAARLLSGGSVEPAHRCPQRRDVVHANQQVPWEHSALRAKFYFAAAHQSVSAATPAQPPVRRRPMPGQRRRRQVRSPQVR